MTFQAKGRTLDSVGAQRVLRTALFYGGIVSLAIAFAGGAFGVFFVGWWVLPSILIGVSGATFFLGLTALSILIANRFQTSELYGAAFFAIVLGTWIFKSVIFLGVILLLRNQPWVHSFSLFLSLIVAVLGMLVVDVVSLVRLRVSIVDERIIEEHL